MQLARVKCMNASMHTLAFTPFFTHNILSCRCTHTHCSFLEGTWLQPRRICLADAAECWFIFGCIPSPSDTSMFLNVTGENRNIFLCQRGTELLLASVDMLTDCARLTGQKIRFFLSLYHILLHFICSAAHLIRPSRAPLFPANPLMPLPSLLTHY